MTMKELETYRGRRVVVAMSGGVDSSLAAVLLKRAGAEVIGVHMRVWHYDDTSEEPALKIGTCCTPADANDARRVAEQFDFPFYAIDFEADFRRAVIEPFIGDYLSGRTPNPCVHCNTQLKLGVLLHKAKAFGAEAVATGHYARVQHRPGQRSELLRAVDSGKDQTYYLFELRQEQLRHLIMPLGGMTKAAVRDQARDLGLHLADKPDSQDICFVPDNDYRRFLDREGALGSGKLDGAVVDTRGKVLGRHSGVHNFTIGQRRGIGISSARPLYVVELLVETQTVVVGGSDQLLSGGLIVDRLNWVGRERTEEPIRVRAQIRYRHQPVPATLHAPSNGGDPPPSSIIFDQPQRAIAPGQAVVCYDEGTGRSVVAGGWIRGPINAELEDAEIDTVQA